MFISNIKLCSFGEGLLYPYSPKDLYCFLFASKNEVHPREIRAVIDEIIIPEENLKLLNEEASFTEDFSQKFLSQDQTREPFGANHEETAAQISTQHQVPSWL